MPAEQKASAERNMTGHNLVELVKKFQKRPSHSLHFIESGAWLGAKCPIQQGAKTYKLQEVMIPINVIKTLNHSLKH